MMPNFSVLRRPWVLLSLLLVVIVLNILPAIPYQGQIAGECAANPIVPSPSAIAITPDGSRMLIASATTRSVHILTTATLAYVGTTDVGLDPRSITLSPDGTKAYVLNQGDGSVSILSTDSTVAPARTTIATVPVGSFPSGIAFSPDGSKVYVANKGSDSISVLSAANHTILNTLPRMYGVKAIAITHDGTRAYVLGPDSITVFSPIDDRQITSFAVGNGATSTMAFSPDGSRAYVANSVANSLSVFDTATDTYLATIPVGKSPSSIIFSPDGTKAYVTNAADNTVSVVDTMTHAVTATIPVGDFPQSIVFSPDGTKAYIANRNSNTVSVISTVSESVIATESVGSGPTAIAFAPDGMRAYVANFTGTSLSIIDVAHDALLPPCSGNSSAQNAVLCGNDSIDPDEQCGEPDLSCSAGTTCVRCQCVPAMTCPSQAPANIPENLLILRDASIESFAGNERSLTVYYRSGEAPTHLQKERGSHFFGNAMAFEKGWDVAHRIALGPADEKVVAGDRIRLCALGGLCSNFVTVRAGPLTSATAIPGECPTGIFSAADLAVTETPAINQTTSCGNGMCDGGENHTTCAQDCACPVLSCPVPPESCSMIPGANAPDGCSTCGTIVCPTKLATCGNGKLDPREICEGTIGQCSSGESCDAFCQCVPTGTEPCPYREPSTIPDNLFIMRAAYAVSFGSPEYNYTQLFVYYRGPETVNLEMDPKSGKSTHPTSNLVASGTQWERKLIFALNQRPTPFVPGARIRLCTATACTQYVQIMAEQVPNIGGSYNGPSFIPPGACPAAQGASSSESSVSEAGATCGNNQVDDGEQCGEPGLTCASGNTCSDCQCVCDIQGAIYPVNAQRIAMTPDGTKAYVLNTDYPDARKGNDLAVISTVNNAVISRVEERGTMMTMAPDGSKLFIGDHVLATADNSLIRGTGEIFASPTVFTSDSRRALTIDRQSNVYIRSTETSDNGQRILVPGARMLSVLPRGSYGEKLYVTSTNGTIAVIPLDESPIAIQTTIPVRAASPVVFTPDGSKAYVAGDCTSSTQAGTAGMQPGRPQVGYEGICVLSTATNAVIATIRADDLPYKIVITPDGTKAYALTPISVVVIDVAKNAITALIPLEYAGGDGAKERDILVTPDGKYVYVANATGRSMTVIATADNSLQKTVLRHEGWYPSALAVTPDSAKVYAVTPGGVSVFYTSKEAVTTCGVVTTPQQTTCGNGVCDTGETSISCSSDCLSSSVSSLRPTAAVCPNGILDSGEECEIGVSCSNGYTCDHACHCVPPNTTSSVATVSCGAGQTLVGGQCRVITANSSASSSAPNSSSAIVAVSGGTCGNGVVNAGEQCGEPGIACASGQYCDSSCICHTISYCGNGTVDARNGEQCELNSDCASGSVCNAQCQCVAAAGGVCGNRTIEKGEQCESGIPCSAGQTCSNCLCQPAALCGNGIRERGEQCDTNAPCPGGQACQGCRCVVLPACGNDVLEAGEQCENDSQCLVGQACNRASCTCMGVPQTTCDNGVLESGEQCEIGSPCSGAGQSCNLKTCQCVPTVAQTTCGNGQLDQGEDCDISHACAEGSTCDFASCHCSTKVNVCRDAKVGPGEQCDIGSPCADASAVCDPSSCLCVKPSQPIVCGSGIAQPGKECDVGIPCPFGWSCDFSQCLCEKQAVCGNGVIDPGEQCETNRACDGKNQTCDFSSCRCRGAVPPTMVAGGTLCGNGIQEPPEECDVGDQNGKPGSGCSTSCTLVILPTIIQTVGHFIPPPTNAIPERGTLKALFAEIANEPSSPGTTGAHLAPQIPNLSAIGGTQSYRATVTPLTSPVGPAGKTGPEILVVIASGMAGGWAWMRRKRRVAE